jgi:hypothetical protein
VIDREPRALAVVAKEIGLSQLEFPGRPWGEHHHQQRALGESMVDRPRRVEDMGLPKSPVGAFVVTTPLVLLRRNRRCWATPGGVDDALPEGDREGVWKRKEGSSVAVSEEAVSGPMLEGTRTRRGKRRVPCLHSWLGLLRRS